MVAAVLIAVADKVGRYPSFSDVQMLIGRTEGVLCGDHPAADDYADLLAWCMWTSSKGRYQIRPARRRSIE